MKKSLKYKNIYMLVLLFNFNITSANDEVIVERNGIVDGKPISDYVNHWWQWAVSMSSSQSPVRDNSGQFCHINQKGSVWFLSGGYGSSKISRKCSIPKDKYIFFPVINMLYYPPEHSKPSCESVKKSASVNNQFLNSFKVEIDGNKYVNPVFYRYGSVDCFDLMKLKTNIFNMARVFPAATDGYWVMLNPLSVGKHKIAFGAEYYNPNNSYGMMVQDIEYEIEVF